MVDSIHSSIQVEEHAMRPCGCGQLVLMRLSITPLHSVCQQPRRRQQGRVEYADSRTGELKVKSMLIASKITNYCIYFSHNYLEIQGIEGTVGISLYHHIA